MVEKLSRCPAAVPPAGSSPISAARISRASSGFPAASDSPTRFRGPGERRVAGVAAGARARAHALQGRLDVALEAHDRPHRGPHEAPQDLQDLLVARVDHRHAQGGADERQGNAPVAHEQVAGEMLHQHRVERDVLRGHGLDAEEGGQLLAQHHRVEAAVLQHELGEAGHLGLGVVPELLDLVGAEHAPLDEEPGEPLPGLGPLTRRRRAARRLLPRGRRLALRRLLAVRRLAVQGPLVLLRPLVLSRGRHEA